MTLSEDNESELFRQIVIPVEVPEIQVVHTAELRLFTGNGSSDDNSDITSPIQIPTHAAVGHMVPAELTLCHTRRWCAQKAEDQEPSGPQQLEFSYELHVNQDLWLIGGRRRGNFLAQEGEVKKFAVMLLPQKAGHLLLPSIEIKTFVVGSAAAVATNIPTTATPIAGTGTANGGTSSVTSPTSATTTTAGPWAQQQRRQIPNEVDWKNHGETLLVLPDLRKTTVSLDSGNPGLIDSESRIVVV